MLRGYLDGVVGFCFVCFAHVSVCASSVQSLGFSLVLSFTGLLIRILIQATRIWIHSK